MCNLNGIASVIDSLRLPGLADRPEMISCFSSTASEYCFQNGNALIEAAHVFKCTKVGQLVRVFPHASYGLSPSILVKVASLSLECPSLHLHTPSSSEDMLSVVPVAPCIGRWNRL